KEGLKGVIFERIEKWVSPKIQDKVDAIFGKIFKKVRLFADNAVDAALTAVGSIPLIGWLLVAVIQEGYNFLMEQATEAINGKITENIMKLARKLFDKTAGKLIDKLV